MISGHVFELIEYDAFERGYGYVILTKQEREERIERRRWIRDFFGSGEVDKEKSFYSSVQRSKTKLRRIMYANAWKWVDGREIPIPPRFVTFTFRDHITDLSFANHEFMKFIQRLNYELVGKATFLKYANVPEYMKNGRVHFHAVFFNMEYIEGVYDLFADLWGLGFVRFLTVHDLSVSTYLLKYMDKAFGNTDGHKRYSVSKGIKMPIIIRDEAMNPILNYLSSFSPKETRSFSIPFVGEMDYTKYELGYVKTIASLPLDKILLNEIELGQHS